MGEYFWGFISDELKFSLTFIPAEMNCAFRQSMEMIPRGAVVAAKRAPNRTALTETAMVPIVLVAAIKW